MDELITSFFKQCASGRVQIGEFFYNIHFQINEYNKDNIPVIKVKNKETFYNYIKEFLNLFSEDEWLNKLVYLFSNLSFSDFNDIVWRLKKSCVGILFVKAFCPE